MKKKEAYIVRFPGLKERNDTFEFVLDDSFFAFHDQGGWQTGDVKVRVEMEKKPDMITLHFTLKGTVQVICDRCLEYYPEKIGTEEVLYLKYGDDPGEMEENVVVIGRDEHQVDVSHFMYEFLVLALPLKKVHPDRQDGSSGCDPVMMKQIEKHQASEEQKETDPRWEDLKKLIEKN